MSGDDSRNSGLYGAHTRAENSGAAIEADQARAAKVGTVRATVEAAVGDLAGQFVQAQDEPEQHSLLLDEIDEQQCLFGGPVRHVAETIETARRGRGRPKGSQNKRSADFADTLMRMGFRHPGINLAMIANADPVDLAAELSQPYRPKSGPRKDEWVEESVTPGEALALIVKANAELLPYFESKAPTKVDVKTPGGPGIMIIGEMTVQQQAESKIIDLTKFDDPT